LTPGLPAVGVVWAVQTQVDRTWTSSH
jgi:hypothetical protein